MRCGRVADIAVLPAVRRLAVALVVLLVLSAVTVPSNLAAEPAPVPGSLRPSSAPASRIALTPAEKHYLARLGSITVCPDPDWPPYERMDGDGNFTGIAADLLKLLAERLGITFTYVQARDWDEAVVLSKAGKVHILPFLNQTPKREQWLIFTEPLFLDPNVFITREEHPFITNAALLKERTIAVPSGTSIEEKVRRDFPNLQVLNTGNSEAEVFKAVAERRADLTLRSLTVSAYTIRKGGWFNLKIAGQAPDDYINRLRIGVLKSEPMLRDILNKGIASITPEEREEITNRHVNITVVKPVDYGFILRVAAVLAALIGLSFYWNLRLKRINAALAESERSKSVLLANLPGMAYRCRFDRNWTMEFLSEGCKELTGYSSDDLLMNSKLSFNDLIAPEYRDWLWEQWRQAVENRQPAKMEYLIMTADNRKKWVFEQGVPVYGKDGQVEAIEGIIVDITERKLVEEQMQHLARYDNLTDLPNRALFSELLQQTLALAQRESRCLALLFLDLDRFKPVNDTYGHKIGDLLLKEAARRMRQVVRASDAISRIGGDEFVVLLAKVENEQSPLQVAEKLRSALEQPFLLDGHTIRISVTIGIALYPEHGTTELELCHHADVAMYAAKEAGRNTVRLFSA